MINELLYPDLSYRIIGCCFSVYNALGPFYREPIYQKALEIELSKSGITYARKRPIDLCYSDQFLGNQFWGS